MAKILELVKQKEEVSIPDMLRAIAGAIEAGEIEAASGTVVLKGGVEEPVKVFGLGTSKELGDSVVDLELGKLRLLRVPLNIMLNTIEL